MKEILVFFLLGFLCQVNAKGKVNEGALEWPFYMENEDLYVDVNIGNPSQEIQISLYYFHQNRDLTLVPKYSDNQFYGGQFDVNVSKTLINLKGNIYSADGELIGTNMYDDFEIANRTFVAIRFLVEDHVPEYELNAVLGFGIPNYEYSSFWSEFYKDFPEKIITVIYNNYPDNGLLVVGETAKKYCHDDWSVFHQKYWYYEQKKHDFDMPRAGSGPWYEPYQSFGVEIDSIVVGNKTFSDINARVLFKLNDDEIRWPTDLYYDLLINALGSKNNKTISCDQKENIKFAAKNSFIELTPEMYLDKDDEDKDKCSLIGEVVDKSDDFSIPRSFFKDYCLSISPYDQEIGIAPLHKQPKTTTTTESAKQVVNDSPETTAHPLLKHQTKEKHVGSGSGQNFVSTSLFLLVIVKLVV